MNVKYLRGALLQGSCLLALLPASVHAQSTPSAPARDDVPAAQEATGTPDGNGEVIVTARRRNETSIAVPVTITAVGGAELQRRGIAGVDGLSRAVPSLVSSETNGSPQGGIVAIRGLSGVESNPMSDQAVSFNIDGVPVARSSVRRLSQMDVAQIEVLKGPQSLFFGKNSPAGIISIRSSDPGSKPEARVSAGYEFKADEIRYDSFFSTPLTDSLGFRVAGYFSDIKGWIRNDAPSSGPGVFAPISRRAPHGSEYAVRGTLKWTASDRFDARLKVSHNDYDGGGATDAQQQTQCPLGAPQTASKPPENCVADDRGTYSDNIGPNFMLANPQYRGNRTFLKSGQTLGSLEINYKLVDWLQLSSISGYYRGMNQYVGSFAANYDETTVLPRQVLASFSNVLIREVTQEARLTSSLDGAFNFMVGGLYQDTHGENTGIVYRNAFAPIFSANATYGQDGSSYSVFGSADIAIFDQLHLAGGARYSHEEKTLSDFRSAKAALPLQLVPVNIISNHVTYNNVSPEVTLTYRPTQRLTLYGAYKQGFLSGGFNTSQPTLAATNAANGNYVSLIDPRYSPQNTKGYEFGVKALALDGNLRANLSYYDYKTTGLQVTATVNLVQTLANAGKVTTRGVDFDFSYRTPIEGLSLTGAVSYEDGRYDDYQAICYRGLAAPQCRVQVNRFTGQSSLYNDLSGTQLTRAPKWSGNVGADYVSLPFSGVKLGLSGNVSFSSSFYGSNLSSPGVLQKSYQLIDSTIRLIDARDRWELALVGRNLGNTHYFVRAADEPFTGSPPGLAPAASFRADTYTVLSRSREVMLRLTVNFGS